MQPVSSPTFEIISVIIPVFNCGDFLCKAIDSILVQTLQNTEIVVIDDGSTDRTADICLKYNDKIRYFHQENRGVSSARNLGLKQSLGEFIIFLDADDILLPNSLELLRKSLEKQNESMITIGLSQEIVKENTLWKSHKNPYRGAYLSATMFRKEIFKIVGRFDENLNIGEDIDLFFRLRELQIPIAYLDQVILLYRRHENNSSKAAIDVHKSLLKACRQSLNRRRINGLKNSLEIFGQ